jgi:hypothetical protein
VSAHASLEELALVGRMGGALGVPEEASRFPGAAARKPQPPNVKFTIPADDAPNVLERSISGSP